MYNRLTLIIKRFSFNDSAEYTFVQDFKIAIRNGFGSKFEMMQFGNFLKCCVMEVDVVRQSDVLCLYPGRWK